jgi:DNA repair exonuclease SbcCD ATPase subunit
MRFTWLTIENFRSHLKTELTLERLSVIRGENAVGKSSIEEALGFLLAGRTLATGSNGQGAHRLIHADADKAVITGELANGTRMRASLTEKGGRNFQSKNGDLPPAIPRDAWSCLCSTRYFFRLKPEEQRDLLANLVVPAEVETPPEGLEVLGPAMKTCSLRDIDDAYKIAFEERTDVNRRIRDWREPEKPSDEEIDVDAVRAQIGERQQELDDAKDERRKLLKDSESRAGKLADLDQREKELTEFIEEQERELERVSKDMMSDATLKKYQATAANAKQQKKLREEYVAAEVAAKNAKAALDTAAALEDNPTCPTCKQPITTEVMEALLGPLSEASVAANTRRNDIKAEADALGDTDLAALRVSEHNQAAGNVQRIQTKLEDLRKKQGKLAKERTALGSEPAGETPDTSEIDATIGDLEQRIHKGWTIHSEAAMAAQRRLSYDAAWRAREELDTEKARLDRACEVLGPKGIRVKLLDQYVGIFAKGMMSVLQPWGYTIDLSLEPYVFRLEYGKRAIDLDLLSESQQLRFGIAFQVALTAHLRIGFVVIDRVDMLDAASRRVLFNQLLEDERIDQAILLVTDEKMEAPPAPGSVFYRLELDANNNTTATEQLRTPDEEAAA